MRMVIGILILLAIQIAAMVVGLEQREREGDEQIEMEWRK